MFKFKGLKILNDIKVWLFIEKQKQNNTLGTCFLILPKIGVLDKGLSNKSSMSGILIKYWMVKLLTQAFRWYHWKFLETLLSGTVTTYFRAFFWAKMTHFYGVKKTHCCTSQHNSTCIQSLWMKFAGMLDMTIRSCLNKKFPSMVPGPCFEQKELIMYG